MSSNSTIRTRSERVATIQVDSLWNNVWRQATQRSTLLRLGISVLAAILIGLSVEAWNPPFAYHQGYIPPRAIVARVYFEMLDKGKTDSLRAEASREVICFYENRNQPIVQLRNGTKNQILRLRGDIHVADLTPEQRDSLNRFLPSNEAEPSIIPEDALIAIQSVIGEEGQIERLDLVLRAILDPIEETGLLKSLSHKIDEGNQAFIRVFESGQESKAVDVEVSRVRFAEVSAKLREAMIREFRREFNMPEAEVVAGLVSNFIQSQLTETLTLREDLTEIARSQRAKEVQPAKFAYFPSKTTMVQGGRPLGISDIEILRAEYEAWIAKQSWLEYSIRLLAYAGMLIALYLLCGLFFHYQFDRSLITNTWKLTRLLGLSTVCISLSSAMSRDPWRAELIPVVVCAATATIAYGRNVTLVLLAALSLGITLSLGMDLAEFVILMSAGASTTLLLGRIRSRQRLIYVTSAAALVAAATTVGVGALVGQINGVMFDLEAVPVVGAYGNEHSESAWGNWFFLVQLMKVAGQNAIYTLVAGLVISGLLPFVERIFSVQTDLSLLELGDASNSLLRQLAQRAPGTYNHSINVAAIAEAAADSIGAHGLLARVGAYFHDIGKMFKPTYFIENQAQGGNRHDALQPAMSTLVIIAHVKDGADLARQHHLPQPIIDFIEQHHGTTLVEFFYRKEAKKFENDPEADEVSEVTFRYPGPKPQTHESAILMMADAVESASRTLVEPTPTRLQNLIDQIAMKRLTDGQFDECGLTLSQLATVKHSLLKSLTAIYHGRIKYTDQQTA
ncbi:MAG: HDIG domain-containing protein [Pirellulaceae bacterium]|nr:HDIG domain-containing protein [Pirellulaceae bacterium]